MSCSFFLKGKGAFGTVYLVSKGNNKYALKVIPLVNLEGSESKAVEKENLGNYFKEVEIFKTVFFFF